LVDPAPRASQQWTDPPPPLVRQGKAVVTVRTVLNTLVARVINPVRLVGGLGMGAGRTHAPRIRVACVGSERTFAAREKGGVIFARLQVKMLFGARLVCSAVQEGTWGQNCE
jgi:hypothetical protein